MAQFLPTGIQHFIVHLEISSFILRVIGGSAKIVTKQIKYTVLLATDVFIH